MGIHGRVCYLQNLASGTVITPAMDGNPQEARLQSWPYLGDKNQLWTINFVDPKNEVGHCNIVNKGLNTLMDLGNGSHKNGTQIYGWRANPTAQNQRWWMQLVTPGDMPVYKIKAAEGGNFVDLDGGKHPGTIHSWSGDTHDNNPNQLWRVVFVEEH